MDIEGQEFEKGSFCYHKDCRSQFYKSELEAKRCAKQHAELMFPIQDIIDAASNQQSSKKNHENNFSIEIKALKDNIEEAKQKMDEFFFVQNLPQSLKSKDEEIISLFKQEIWLNESAIEDREQGRTLLFKMQHRFFKELTNKVNDINKSSQILLKKLNLMNSILTNENDELYIPIPKKQNEKGKNISIKNIQNEKKCLPNNDIQENKQTPQRKEVVDILNSFVENDIQREIMKKISGNIEREVKVFDDKEYGNIQSKKIKKNIENEQQQQEQEQKQQQIKEVQLIEIPLFEKLQNTKESFSLLYEKKLLYFSPTMTVLFDNYNRNITFATVKEKENEEYAQQTVNCLNHSEEEISLIKKAEIKEFNTKIFLFVLSINGQLSSYIINQDEKNNIQYRLKWQSGQIFSDFTCGFIGNKLNYLSIFGFREDSGTIIQFDSIDFLELEVSQELNKAFFNNDSLILDQITNTKQSQWNILVKSNQQFVIFSIDLDNNVSMRSFDCKGDKGFIVKNNEYYYEENFSLVSYNHTFFIDLVDKGGPIVHAQTFNEKIIICTEQAVNFYSLKSGFSANSSKLNQAISAIVQDDKVIVLNSNLGIQIIPIEK